MLKTFWKKLIIRYKLKVTSKKFCENCTKNETERSPLLSFSRSLLTPFAFFFFSPNKRTRT